MPVIKTTEMECYCNYIEKELLFEKPENVKDVKDYQRKKFKLISKLASDLYKYKNSRDCYKTISNLMILTMSSFEENLPIDKYSERHFSPSKKYNNNFKSILVRELR